MSMCAGACDVIMVEFSMCFSHVQQKKKFGLNFNFIFFSKTSELGVGGSVNLKIKKLWPKITENVQDYHMFINNR